MADQGDARPVSPTTSADDVHSFARPAETRVRHVSLDLRADFDSKQLSGTATLGVEVAEGHSRVVLDTRDLDIRSVKAASGQPLPFQRGLADPILGQALTIDLSPGLGSPSKEQAQKERTQKEPTQPRKVQVVIEYATSPSAPALQWLTPSQTAGGKRPYLFSQGQAILTRSWIPTQDSPGVRQTYEARVTVPKPLTAVMSAEHLTPKGVEVPGGRRFDFKMTEPIPPYLFAIAIGDIASRPLGSRTAVFAEPSVLDRVAHEFADLEKMLAAAERTYGPYRWGRYDILVLPPSFPFGGMENPRLTFATPTILAGDRSLTSLVAHELAHSWSGNLVTNATWSDFWLNEGFTVYFEYRIMEGLYGPERAAMLDALGRRELADEVARLGKTSPDTRLHVDLKGRNPDDAVGPIAYEKGAAFLRTIEHVVGRERFDAFLRSWFERRGFTSVTTAEFLTDLREHLLKHDRALEDRIRIDEWVYQPGLPDNAPIPRTDAFTRVEREVTRFVGGTTAAQLETKDWVTQQWQHFLVSLPAELPADRLADLDRAFAFTKTGNSEILFAWLRHAIRHRYAPALPALEHFLTSQGRRKFLKPLYEDLMATEWGKAEARRMYARARPLYHAVTVQTLDEIVK